MTQTTPSESNPSVSVSAKKLRDTSHRFTVRQHARTNFLAFAYRGNLYTLFPRSINLRVVYTVVSVLDSTYNTVRYTNEAWIEKTEVRPILFGLLYLAKQPYRPSAAEPI